MYLIMHLMLLITQLRQYETLQKEDIETENTTEGYKRAKSILEVKESKI